MHEWAIGLLDEAARTRVDRAMREAIDALRDECCGLGMSSTVRARLGLPSDSAMREMLGAIDRSVWSRAARTMAA